ncbi:MAG: hypothetical protein RKO66_04905 [Candidatus Contendobacter sp.]|nr:hypothetical protein [Candidatus Contendobacter sp.]MDS4058011.1 hypothetical protein [Candidatus Contendobacter sp.]
MRPRHPRPLARELTMLSPERFYLLSFLALSIGIGLALRWPVERRGWGLVVGGSALGIATLLGGYLASVGGVAALLQQPAPTLGWPALQPAFAQFWASWQTLANTLQQWQPGLSPNLWLILLFLGAYLAIKLVLVFLAWLAGGVLKLFGAQTRPAPPLPPQAAFLQDTARWGLLALALLLGALPHAMNLSPLLARFFEALFWAGLWIQLLELGQWLRVARIDAPETAGANAVGEERAEPDLEPLYRDYLRLHQAPEIGDRALLFDGGIDPPRAPDAPPAPFPAAEDGDIARQFYPRLQQALPPRLLEDLRHLANRYERGDDLLFAETPCGHHFLWLAELIQHHKNRGEVALLIAPDAAIAQVEAALRQQVDRHQLRLTQRWVVLGRDPLPPSAQADLLIGPDRALETHLFEQLHVLAPTLRRLRLLICLDVQDLRLSTLRLALGRLWLRAPRERVRVVAQAEPYQDVEQQVRYLLDFPPNLAEHRLNPQLLARRYWLVWDAHSPRRHALGQYFFPGYQGPLELNELLLLPAWQQGFEVLELDPDGRRDADGLEHLRDDLLAQHGHHALLDHCRRHRPVAHGYAAAARWVRQCEDAANLPLALDRNLHFSDASASLLNVVCGPYPLRDYFRACLRGAGHPRHLPTGLRPLAVRPQGTLPEIAAALGAALRTGPDGAGSSRTDITEQFLNRAPVELREAFGVRADWASLGALFALTQTRPLSLRVALGADGEPRYSIPSDSPAAPDRFRVVRNESGEPIERWSAEDHGLRYAIGQRVWIEGKCHRIRAVDANGVSVHHQESEEKDLRRHYVFARRYRFEDGARYREGTPQRWGLGDGLAVEIAHLHAAFRGISDGYWELPEDRRPLARDFPVYVALESPVDRPHRLQNVAHLRFRQPGLVGDAELATVAFTLCAVLQDCLESLFPPQSARLAVASPQSARFDPEQDEIARFYHRLYPALDPGPTPVDPVADESAQSLDLYLFEDADHDLGVVRAVCDGRGSQVWLDLAGDYLTWAATQPAEQLYQAYGGSGLPACLDYPGTLALLDKLRQSGPRPVVAPLTM